MNRKQKRMLLRIIISCVLVAAFIFIPTEGLLRFVLFMIPYLIIGYDILIKALKGILRGQPFDENFLMAIATIGAIILGDYIESTAVMLFYQIGELFQSYAVGKSRRNISALMDIRPDYANIEREDGTFEAVSPDEVAVGSIILVKVGEKVPIDGVVVEGKSALDMSALTGESIPRDVMESDEIISGSVNMSAAIRIKTTKEFSESTASRILELIETASSRKSQPENFISKFAKYYTPAVCFAALVLALFPPLISIILGASAEWGKWIYRALTFLVISCPCALVISIPLGFFAGIGGASRAGILVKGSNCLEVLSKVKIVVFDKTGTLTEGVFRVVGVYENNIEREKLVEYAALAEIYSTHPISKSLQEACTVSLDASRVKPICELGGHGVESTVDGVRVAVGNEKLMHSLGIDVPSSDRIGTIVHVAIDGEYAGQILISDVIKTSAKRAVSALKKMGVKKTVMLTGDTSAVGKEVSRELSVDEAYCELLPSDKVTMLETLMSENKGDKIAFVGDGINDAPVLTRADVGVAMGALGSDSAIEAADVVLMDDDPEKLAAALRIAHKCLRIVYQNIYFAIGIKFICLILGALGEVNMGVAIFADVGVMVLAVLNAMRSLNVKKM